jgi:hypothetical protein
MRFGKIAVEIKSSGKTCKDDCRDHHGGKDIKQAAARANDLCASGHVRVFLCDGLSDWCTFDHCFSARQQAALSHGYK